MNFGRQYVFERSIKSFILNNMLLPSFRRRERAAEPQLAVFSSDLIGQGVNLYGKWEHEELEVLREWLIDQRLTGGALIDIGANIGNHSVFLSPLFENVVAVEASPRIFKLLQINAESRSNIKCHNVAASDRPGTLQFATDTANLGHSRVAIGEDPDAGSRKLDSVTCLTMDELLGDVPNIRVVKIDVEGHELQALTGMQRTLRNHKPLVVFEQHPGDFNDGTSPVVELLKSYGYKRLFSIDRVPFNRRSGPLGRWAFLLVSVIFGFRVKVVEIHDFKPAFYEMIVAQC
jgi:FkbM family methyltransferase